MTLSLRWTVPCLGHLRRICAVGLAALLLVPAARAESIPLSDYFQQSWTSADGLPHNLVADIAQTDEGYLWIATWEGVVRYNGHEFDVFTERDIPGLSDRGITELDIDGDRELLVGTARGGMMRRKSRQWQIISTDLGEGAPSIYSFLYRGQQTLIGTAGDGVLALDNQGRVARPSSLDPLHRATVYAMVEDRQGTVWLGTDAGLLHWREPGDPQAVGSEAGLPQSAVLSLVVGDDDSLYVGTERGVYLLRQGQAGLLDAQLARVSVESLMRDSRGDLWVGTAAHGIYRLSEHGLENLDARTGLPNNRVASMLEDREGSIWIGTNSGLFRLREAPFHSVTRKEGLAGNYARTLLANPEGGMWVGTSAGLSQIGVDGRVVRDPGYALPDQSILSMALDQQGGLWLGTYYEGLVHWTPGQTLQHLDRESGLPSNQIRALLSVDDGTLWIGTSRGLVRLRQGQMRVFTEADGLPNTNILALHRDQNQILWVGTSLGMARSNSNGDRFEPVRSPVIASVQRIYGFDEDATGTLWVASDRGILRWQGQRWSRLGAEHGLPVASAFSVNIGLDGQFWLSSNRGVVRIPAPSMLAALDRPGTPLQSELFTEADGMASAQCNGAAGKPALKDERGVLWFATSIGVARIDPRSLSEAARMQPAVVLEDVRVDGEDRPIGERLQVPADSRRIEISFVGLSFQAPERTRYRYRLEGFDEEWMLSERNRRAQFTNLAPGQYRFRGSAANPNGEWSEREAVLDIDVVPHWWQRRDVQIGLLLLAAVLVWLGFQVRLQVLQRSERRLRQQVAAATETLRSSAERLREQNLELDAFAHTVAHDLKTPLTTVLGLARVLDKAYQDLPENTVANSIERIYATGKKMAGIIDALLLLSQARSDQRVEIAVLDHHGLVQEAWQRLQELVDQHQSSLEWGPLPVSRGYAPWVEEVWVNYLSNAIKYGGNLARVEIGGEVQDGGCVRYFVRDHGPGLDLAAQKRLFQPFTRIAEIGGEGHGLGLSIVRRIVGRLGGQVGCDSAPGAGSTFWFTLPAVGATAADAVDRRPTD